jgi:transposase InsO family protein
MTWEDVKPSVSQALHFAGLAEDTPPKLLSDNGSCYISHDLRDFLKTKGIKPINGKPCHPQTQGKIERYHRTMKNVVKLNNYYTPDELRLAIADFVNYYNKERYHESLQNLTPADVYYGRGPKILKERQLIKNRTFADRRKIYIKNALALILDNI